MRRVALMFCLFIPLSAQQGPFNLDFNDSGPGGEPAGWAWAPNSSYSITTVADCRLPDSRCALVRHQGESFSRDPVYLMQSFDAAALRGKQVRYRASLRLEGPGLSSAHLFVRVDRRSGVGFHNYSLDQPIRSNDWAVREIVGKIDDDAVSVTIGVIYRGHGSGYFADPEFEAVEN